MTEFLRTAGAIFLIWAIVAAFIIVVTTLWEVGKAIGSAVLVAREYYRDNPDAVPPDRWLVRVGLWGVR